MAKRLQLFTILIGIISLLGNTPAPTPLPADIIPTPVIPTATPGGIIPTPIPPPTITTAHRQAFLFAGPGETHQQVGILNPGVEIEIIERNAIGNWLHIVRKSNSGTIAQDGWLMIGVLNIPENLRFSELPVNTTLPDAAPENVDSQSMSQLYALPIIPAISENMRIVYERGQELGNDPHVVTKVGDSLSAADSYLTILSQPDYQLGPYDYLENTLRFFGPSLETGSVAARIGLSTYVVFDPLWASKDVCQANETPLTCEYRLKQPSIALIMFGPNDVRSMEVEDYTGQMRRIVEQTLERSIIPVLWTFSADPDERFWWQSINFNLALIDIAAEYDVPLINLWSAARHLPKYGLDIDRIHLLQNGITTLDLASGDETWYGATLQNLLALRTLDEIRLVVGIR